jgi:ribosomal protein S18 acetylase RimI-like enzyme
MNISIRLLKKEQFIDQTFDFEYTTISYMDVSITNWQITLTKKSYDQPIHKHFQSKLFESFLECPIAFGAYDEDNHLLGIVEGSIESWHQVFRISNILVNESSRHQGIGKRLLHHLEQEAIKIYKPRAFLLETQTCNTFAISFYEKMGYTWIGIDTLAYSNTDIANTEVRIEMGKKIPSEAMNL